MDVREALSNLLDSADLGRRELDLELQRLEREFGEAVYPEWLALLADLSFPPGEARRICQEISEHRRSMEQRLGSVLDPRVALVAYFLEVDHRFKSPKLVERNHFEKTHDLAYRDELTGLHNYRFFTEQLEREVGRSRRSGAPLSLLMVDADDFKAYNDEHGHDAGNGALATIAELLQESRRADDVAVRYGGEEFAILLPSTRKTGAAVVAERARRKVEAQHGKLTISVGVATFPADALKGEELIRQADRALYVAKALGKNRVEMYGGSTRSDRRLDRSLHGKVHVLTRDRPAPTMVRLSTGGMQLCLDREPPPVGCLIEVGLLLPESNREIHIPGCVLSISRAEGGFYEAVIGLTDLASTDRGMLLRYLLN